MTFFRNKLSILCHYSCIRDAIAVHQQRGKCVVESVGDAVIAAKHVEVGHVQRGEDALRCAFLEDTVRHAQTVICVEPDRSLRADVDVAVVQHEIADILPRSRITVHIAVAQAESCAGGAVKAVDVAVPGEHIHAHVEDPVALAGHAQPQRVLRRSDQVVVVGKVHRCAEMLRLAGQPHVVDGNRVRGDRQAVCCRVRVLLDLKADRIHVVGVVHHAVDGHSRESKGQHGGRISVIPRIRIPAVQQIDEAARVVADRYVADHQLAGVEGAEIAPEHDAGVAGSGVWVGKLVKAHVVDHKLAVAVSDVDAAVAGGKGHVGNRVIPAAVMVVDAAKGAVADGYVLAILALHHAPRAKQHAVPQGKAGQAAQVNGVARLAPAHRSIGKEGPEVFAGQLLGGHVIGVFNAQDLALVVRGIDRGLGGDLKRPVPEGRVGALDQKCGDAGIIRRVQQDSSASELNGPLEDALIFHGDRASPGHSLEQSAVDQIAVAVARHRLMIDVGRVRVIQPDRLNDVGRKMADTVGIFRKKRNADRALRKLADLRRRQAYGADALVRLRPQNDVFSHRFGDDKRHA